MAEFLFTCPKTGGKIPTGVTVDAKGLRRSWMKALKLNCVHCGEIHTISVRETFLEVLLNDAVDRTGPVGRDPLLERTPHRKPVAS
jgi:hypothetical protein